MPLAKKTIGLIGLGLMGSALAYRLEQNGFSLLGYDIAPEQAEGFRSLGFETTASAREVVKECDPIIFSVMTTTQVADTLRASADDLRPEQIIIDCSTGEPDDMATLGEWLSHKDVGYVDATIAGNSDETRKGSVLTLVGGTKENVDTCDSIFRAFSKRTFHLGPIGYGARMKLVFNLVLGLHRAVLGEALGFAEKLNIPPETALEILKQGTTYSHVMDNKGEKMLTQDFTPQARLRQHHKDVRLMLELAARYQAKVPFSKTHEQLLAQLLEAGYGDLDNSAIVKAFKRSPDEIL